MSENNNNKELNKKSRYKIIHHFAQKISCDVHNGLNTFAENKGKKTKTGVKVDINVTKISTSQEKSTYQIKILLTVAASNDDEKEIYRVSCIYFILIEIDDTLTDDQKSKIVMVDVPHKMFPFLNVIASNLIRDSGCGSIMIDTIDFEDLYNNQKNKPKIYHNESANNN